MLTQGYNGSPTVTPATVDGGPTTIMARLKQQQSAWTFDPELTKLDFKKDVYSYECAMFRSFDDELSLFDLKSN